MEAITASPPDLVTHQDAVLVPRMRVYGLSMHPITASQMHLSYQGSLSTSSDRPAGEQAKSPFGLSLQPGYTGAAHKSVKRAMTSADWAMASVNAKPT